MFGRSWTCLGLIATLMFASPAMAAPASATPRIVAVGDIHGDFEAWRAIARAARLIDAKGRWTGGNAVLVQTGDVADRGPDTLKIVRDLMRLQREARRAGGRVVALVGNHEAMNVTGDLRYVSAGEYAAFVDRNSAKVRERVYAANQQAIEAGYRERDPEMTGDAARQAWLSATPLGLIEHRAAWRPEGRIGRWIVGNPAAVLLDGTLFVHGGISASYAGVALDEINRRVAAALKARETAPESIINDPAGPLWYRGLARGRADETADPPVRSPASGARPERTVEQELDQILGAYGAKRIVIGHTPVLSGIAVLHGGRLVQIDTGISAVIGGKATYLEIIGDTLVPHVVDRARPTEAGGR